MESPSLKGLQPQLAAAVTDACASVSHNLNGQKLGRKGRITRERILAAAIELIDSPKEPVTLSSVARRASLGMTSLYNYFTDLTELLLAVLEPVMATADAAYLNLLRERWPDDALFDYCYRFVRAYHDFWFRHSRLLHMRNALADQRDERMLAHRIESTRPIISLLVRQMGRETLTKVSPDTSMATMVMIGIERSITVATDRDLRRQVGMGPDVSEDRFLVPGARLMELAIRDARSGSRYLAH
ncbi:TetR/AcrR family transcriptional regulator [Novosphingobium mangrovi (ex Huang et al. 2023)]|uniref:TetR/AcrR family transcriptional regulator n=1 Tax=Novosphingobium mangrovi (ex Huang et al. 2023) TaxID=2976432 RepID=A0ABT2I8D7_9SPHN|nr:TetR/AcrR family transcriptional regulator [Novosphingobium mangrovi (ex Huang et al. 2023)]MCT2400812.1 TetR/AcrR family transcriptional regulator [Novosphingobium mangrovi (ex Huang et al. 2023)]